MSKIAEAVHPIKADAIQRAEQAATKIVERIRHELETHDWDVNAVAPYPNTSRGRREDIAVGVAKYNQYRSVTSPKSGYTSVVPGKPAYVVMDTAKIDRFMKVTRSDAAQQYENFVAKLEDKIGPVVTAVLTERDVWSYSILTVTKEDGTTEHWKTEQIINTSKLGLVFNQWPTRKIK